MTQHNNMIKNKATNNNKNNNSIVIQVQAIALNKSEISSRERKNKDIPPTMKSSKSSSRLSSMLLLIVTTFFLAAAVTTCDAFTNPNQNPTFRHSARRHNNLHQLNLHQRQASSIPIAMSTVVAPPEETTKIDKTNSDEEELTPGEISKRNDAPMEYLEDEFSTRNPDDPFHILLLDTTFTKHDKITVSYVVGCLEYVLGMPSDEGTELTEMAESNGLSCLGTWEREECLSLGKKLQMKDLVVRVVPYCEGGGRGWQMKNADANAGEGMFSQDGVLGGSGFD